MVTASLGPSKGRVDFEFDDFDKAVRDKGMLCYWGRAIHCPCRGNLQTDQADPNCATCGGDGWFYVKPTEAPALQDHINVGHVDLAAAKASQVIVTSITRDPQIFEKLGEWIFGTLRLTGFSWHRFAYRDRFVLKGACMTYQQVLPVPASGVLVVGPRYGQRDLRYPVVELLEAYTVPDAATAPVSILSSITCNADGSLTFSSSVAEGTRVALVYEMNPVLIVMDHVHAVRDTPIAAGTGTVLGIEVAQPRHAMARLDFLVSP